MGVGEKVGIFYSQSGDSQGILIYVLRINPVAFLRLFGSCFKYGKYGGGRDSMGSPDLLKETCLANKSFHVVEIDNTLDYSN